MKLLKRRLCIFSSSCPWRIQKEQHFNRCTGIGSEEVDPAKMETDDDETLPRDQNFLVEDETVETTMYDWEQAQSECDGLFNDTSAFPQSVKSSLW